MKEKDSGHILCIQSYTFFQKYEQSLCADKFVYLQSIGKYIGYINFIIRVHESWLFQFKVILKNELIVNNYSEFADRINSSFINLLCICLHNNHNFFSRNISHHSTGHCYLFVWSNLDFAANYPLHNYLCIKWYYILSH